MLSSARFRENSVSIILRHIRWIMIVAGALTMTMVYAAVAPDAALRSTFGDTLQGPLADIVMRNWGVTGRTKYA